MNRLNNTEITILNLIKGTNTGIISFNLSNILKGKIKEDNVKKALNSLMKKGKITNRNGILTAI